jgi:hypothetical protein
MMSIIGDAIVCDRCGKPATDTRDGVDMLRLSEVLG